MSRTGTDLGAYHSLIPADEPSVHPVGPANRRSYTLNANGGAVGVLICAMTGAVERPFNPGRATITPAQVSGLVRETARLCRLYDIPVSPWSTLSRAEILPTLGIVQRWKWDINRLPGMDQPGDPIAVGNRFREMVRCELLNH